MVNSYDFLRFDVEKAMAECEDRMERKGRPRPKRQAISPKYNAKVKRDVSCRKREPTREERVAKAQAKIKAAANRSSSSDQLSPNYKGLELTEHTKTWHIKLHIYKRILLKRKPLGKKLPYSALTTATILSYIGRQAEVCDIMQQISHATRSYIVQ